MKKLVLMICAAAFLSGCQSDADEASVAETAESEAATAVSERVVRQRSAPGAVTEPAAQRPQGDPARELPRLTGQFAEPGMGLAYIVDGSTPEAFAESLQAIAAETSAEQFSELDSALRFLRFHSSAAWGGLPGLYQSLDNMTGEEIIEHARRLQAERRRGR